MSATFADLFRRVPEPTVRAVGGPDMFTDRGRGENLTAIKNCAIKNARKFYGPDAELKVTSVGTVSRAFRSDSEYEAAVVIQCLNFRRVVKDR